MVVDVLHDIPIKIMNPSDIVFYAPPEVPPPAVRGKIYFINKFFNI